MVDEAPVIPLPTSAAPQNRQSADPLEDFAAGRPPRSAWERRIAGALGLIRRRVIGDYEVDEFGFDPDLTENVLVPALRPLYQRWFRTEVAGVHNIPERHGALLVANHAGG